MKVICIDGVKIGAVSLMGGVADKDDVIIEGEIYTVCDSTIVQGQTTYHLEEKPFWTSYLAKRFSPLSSIDETEMIREYKKELV